MTVDPRVGFWFSIVMAIISALGICGTQLTTLFGDVMANKILAAIVVLNVINGAINAILHAIPSKPGSANEFALGPKAAAPIILLAILVLAAFPHSASAQVKLRAPTGNLANDLGITQAKPPLITGNAEKDLQALWDKIVASSIDDLNYAAAMAKNANTQTSAIRLQCINAIITLNQQASGANLKNADGTPMTKPDPHIFTDVESLAEVVDNLSPQGPLFVNCAGAAQLAKTNVLTFVNAVVTGAAGFAAMPIIPGL
jgi:hypothetical protein